MYVRNRRWSHSSIGRKVNTLPLRQDALDNIIGAGGDRNYIWELRLSLNAYANLCELLKVQGDDTIVDEADTIDVVESSHEWTQWREDLATEIKLLPHHASGLNKKLNNLWSSWKNWLLKARGPMSVNSNQGHFKLANKMNEKFPRCGKPFPLFERLENIFGKDRAIGLEACGGKDAEDDVTSGSTFATATAGGLGLDEEDVDMGIWQQLRANYPIPFRPLFLHQDQGKHVQILANAMSGVNEQVNLGRTLKSLSFNTMEIVQIAKKVVQNPELKATFWSLDEEKAIFCMRYYGQLLVIVGVVGLSC
ncbi:hypothetical protein Ahy_A06g029972 [Arachis hypogaea]|uniref:Uncharacterized protein n=1 Tax=Arachis hypogaea TaxID=3818 RepID=A0A445CUR4_ARAHY|nr:hypothetical protein Ahy_A06g029972 [Arachis hypogaea]